MSPKLIGFEFVSQSKASSGLSDSVAAGAWAGGNALNQPSARPIYSDALGGTFMGVPHEDGVMSIPFIPGSPAEMVGGVADQRCGFVALERFPEAGADDGLQNLLGGFAEQLPAQASTDWLGEAATQAMLGGAPGGGLDATLRALGVDNPLATGPMGAAMGSAMQAAGMGPAGGVLASLLSGGGAEGVARSLGNAGLNRLLSNAGPGGVPGLGTLAGLAGGSAGSALGGALADLMKAGGWAGPLDNAGNVLGGCFPGGDTGGLSDIIGDPTNGGCFGRGGPDLGAIGSDALNGAADQMLDQWKVDDESSAAEHIANKAVKDNKGQIKEAVSDPDAFISKMKKLFSGAAPGSGMPAVRMTDLDDGADVSLMGVANILFEGLPVSRITDMVAGPKAPPPGKPIVEGAATVLSAALPTAFLSGKTAVPSVMVKGAPTVLVGGAVASISPPGAANGPSTTTNAGPAGPSGPASTSSGSAGGAEGAPAPSPGLSGSGSSSALGAGAAAGNQPGSFEDLVSGGLLGGVGDLLGKLWTLPNTIIGTAIGGLGHVIQEVAHFIDPSKYVEPDFNFGHNGIEFINNAFGLGEYVDEHGNRHSSAAITLGNAIIYGPGGYVHADHEQQHTYQAQLLGPLYLPAWAIAAITAEVSGGHWHDDNAMERGPNSPKPKPWPWWDGKYPW